MDVTIHSVGLDKDRAEISFVEERHVTQAGVEIQTLQFETASFGAELADITNTVRDLVAAYDVRARNAVDRGAIRNVHALLFGPDTVEVSFVEERGVTEFSTRLKTLQLPSSGYQPEFEVLMEAIHGLLAAAEVKERNPPDRIPV